MKEIVAAKIGDFITTIPKHMIAAVEMNQPIEWIDRERLRFMAQMDLGIRWEQLAIAPTIFCIGDDGLPCSAKAGKHE